METEKSYLQDNGLFDVYTLLHCDENSSKNYDDDVQIGTSKREFKR